MKELRNEETEMSKFLKFIVDLVIICTILIAAALLIPPLAGVKTVMNDNSTAETNLPVGSVAYGKQTDAVNLKKGQKIIYTKNNQAYVYKISDVSDAANDTYQVKDAYDEKAEARSVELSGDVTRLSFVVPLIAYAAIAVQSKEGLIVIGLGIVFLIILFILAELWRKDKKDMEDIETGEKQSEANVIPIKEEALEKSKNPVETEEEKESEPEVPKAQETVETAQKIEEEPEQTLEMDENSHLQDAVEMMVEETAVPVEEKEEEKKEEKLEGTEEGTEPEEIVAEDEKESVEDTSSVEEPAEESVTEEPVEPETPVEEEAVVEEIVQSEESVKAEDTEKPEPVETEVAETVEEETEEEKEEPEEVLPSPSVEELLKMAQAHGDHPEVIEDPDNKVTLLDYTNLF